ncbi:hypothetical protein BC834DRAFT_844133 [Gloeopeniophorella convolvens]|nr:hypothetical protein BC834DRAFT_844133 [Gloeopeniophorella convolvens]
MSLPTRSLTSAHYQPHLHSPRPRRIPGSSPESHYAPSDASTPETSAPPTPQSACEDTQGAAESKSAARELCLLAVERHKHAVAKRFAPYRRTARTPPPQPAPPPTAEELEQMFDWSRWPYANLTFDALPDSDKRFLSQYEYTQEWLDQVMWEMQEEADAEEAQKQE